ncbi:hypothetical protein NC661_04110 [Aquibacillus koreensis]|uniref:Uncharacterized protein n=1 Tax=Aquibacillus koreensis TaxID=279446 RepID=A0A9X4AH26_9BACI|nr:hypothetical protein [Aquibacillus koreensis]MCT2534843.1 hypothetical protein [Aquibacillus koreensis]MDC3419546.1 hypothetical protein [Aquibacillus koreensis]
MEKESNVILGTWMEAIGTIVAAVGSTPYKNISKELLNDLNLVGNVMQGTGNAIMADSIDNQTLNKIGAEIQAIGNTTIVAKYLIDFPRTTELELVIKGNLIQALGAGVSTSTTDWKHKPSIQDIYITYGNILQVIGNTLQAISTGTELRGGEAQTLNVVGSWIQAIGAVMAAIGQSQ